MIELSHWHPVATVVSIAHAPVAVELLGQALVLWRGATGQLHAWADQCPHRGARFSLGRVVQVLGEGQRAASRLECAYHGWQFGSDGQCRLVPALPDFLPPTGHCAKAFEVRQRCGLVWVRLAGHAQAAADGTSKQALNPAVRETQDETADEAAGPPVAVSGSRQVLCGPYKVATSAPRIVENFLDMAHFGFVHEGWLGDPAHVDVPTYQVAEHGRGLVATGCVAYQPKSSVQAAGGEQVEYVYEVTAPFSATLTKVPRRPAGALGLDEAQISRDEPSTSELSRAESVPFEPLSFEPTASGGFRESIDLFVCPVSNESSVVWFRMTTLDLLSPESDLIAFQDAIFQQDKPVLESQTPKRLPLAPDAERHTAADKTSSAYRRYLRAQGVTFGVTL